MRILISILTFCLFITMTVTATAAVHRWFNASKQTECRMDCCGEKKHSSKKPLKKGCCGDMACNPFMACSCCFACFFGKQAAHKLFGLASDFRIPVFDSDIRSRKGGDCFHPPEIV